MTKTVGVFVLAASLAGCFSGTNQTGVRRCVHVFFLIGLYTECEEGPPHGQAVAATPAIATTPAMPAAGSRVEWWCTAREDGLGLCHRGRDACEQFRTGAGAASGYGACFRNETAACAGAECFTSRDVCAAFEAKAGRDGSACSIR